MAQELLTTLLANVSRSFYRTLRVLPAKVRPQIGLAYLLARTTDTIADTELVPVEERLQALRALRARIAGASEPGLDFGNLAIRQAGSAERVLLERCEESLVMLSTFASADQLRVREVLHTIGSGQELDLVRFQGASGDHVVALRSDEELEDYTYRVAGCVGQFWTRICRAHLFPNAPLDEPGLLANSVRFGQGLQLVNILRDLAADLRQGRCYLPQDSLAGLGLKPQDLLQPANEPRLRPLYDRYLDRAENHLMSGWSYTLALPYRHMRVRLACAWPIAIGLETLRLLRTRQVLAPLPPIKVSRRQVRRLFWRSVLFYPWPQAWRNLVLGLPSTRAAKAVALALFLF
jgi:farnesyl-diphosphate farnesyltransferase